MIACLAIVAAASTTGEIRLGTTFPALVGGGGVLEVSRLRLAADLGWMPTPYSDTIDSFIVAVGGYDENVSALLRSLLKNSFVLDVNVGASPFPKLGFYASAGYMVVTLGGSSTSAELIAAVTGQEVPEPPLLDRAPLELDATSTLHNVRLVTGWRFPVKKHLSIDGELGFLHTFASRTVVSSELPWLEGTSSLEVLSAGTDAYLDDIYTSYVWTPTLGVFVGWRFL